METQAKPMLIACAKDPLYLLPAMANRHGLVAGATGTGKTVTLQVMAEQFSAIGVPVFAADIKGDLSGISQAGVDSPKIQERVAKLKLDGFYICAARRLCSGMYLESRAIPFAPPFLRWGRCCSAGCWG